MSEGQGEVWDFFERNSAHDDVWEPPIVLTAHDFTIPAGMFTARVQTSVFARSERNDKGELTDFYWFEHSVSVSCPFENMPEYVEGQVWQLRQFRLRVKQVNQANNGPNISIGDYLQGLGSNLPQPSQWSEVLDHAPKATVGSTNVGDSVSATIGISAGMFGETPQFNASASTTSTRSTSRNIPDVEFGWYGQKQEAIFVLSWMDGVPTSRESFDQDFQLVIRNNDDGAGIRSLTESYAAYAIFEIQMTLQTSFTSTAGHTDKESMPTQSASGDFTRYIFVNLPPLKKSPTVHG